MPRIKSLLSSCRLGTVKHAHKCKGNARHRLAQDDKRLEIRSGRNWHYYCLDCANSIVARDTDKLDVLAKSLRGETS